MVPTERTSIEKLLNDQRSPRAPGHPLDETSRRRICIVVENISAAQPSLLPRKGIEALVWKCNVHAFRVKLLDDVYRQVWFGLTGLVVHSMSSSGKQFWSAAPRGSR